MALRWIFGLPGAALVTALLFLAMAAMIKRDAQINTAPPRIDYSITAKRELIDPPKTRIEKLKSIETAPPVDIQRAPRPGKLPPIDVDPPTGGDTRMKIKLPRLGAPDYKTTPAYPQTCLARGAHGVVIVEFDVTPEGSVVNPRIISSPDSCFNRTVLREVLRWRYTPRTDGGRAVMQRGVRASVNFQLTQ